MLITLWLLSTANTSRMHVINLFLNEIKFQFYIITQTESASFVSIESRKIWRNQRNLRKKNTHTRARAMNASWVTKGLHLSHSEELFILGHPYIMPLQSGKRQLYIFTPDGSICFEAFGCYILYGDRTNMIPDGQSWFKLIYLIGGSSLSSQAKGPYVRKCIGHSTLGLRRCCLINKQHTCTLAYSYPR